MKPKMHKKLQKLQRKHEDGGERRWGGRRGVMRRVAMRGEGRTLYGLRKRNSDSECYYKEEGRRGNLNR
ncbi:hypothetical protein A2U01_0012898 [Trifolium medium]|uniref:Uncharacterized protein n=1 Tax=Trifolium medium TaxID=97028 RepID=A0A392MWP7_9FABA|nr:hypothetical protein [Trifolium medium]